MTTAWMSRAACIGADPALFFPERGEAGQGVPEAKAICRGCPVRLECLDYAIANNEPCGVFGGTTVDERDRIRWKRGAA